MIFRFPINLNGFKSYCQYLLKIISCNIVNHLEKIAGFGPQELLADTTLVERHWKHKT